MGRKGPGICKPNAIAEQEIVELIPAKWRAGKLAKIVKTFEINDNNLPMTGPTHLLHITGRGPFANVKCFNFLYRMTF